MRRVRAAAKCGGGASPQRISIFTYDRVTIGRPWSLRVVQREQQAQRLQPVLIAHHAGLRAAVLGGEEVGGELVALEELAVELLGQQKSKG